MIDEGAELRLCPFAKKQGDYQLEGAIEGVKKTMMPDEVKADLKEFYQWNKK